MEDRHPPQGLAEASSLAPIYAPPYPDESRRGALKKTTPRAARAVLTAPFAEDALQMLPAYMADVSPTKSRWASREPPAPSRNVSATADATGPRECASHNGPDHETPARLESRLGSVSQRETPNFFSGDVSDTHTAFAHSTLDTAAFDASLEYCAHDIVLFWQPPSCLSQ